MRVWDIDLGEVRQSDGFTCGPTSAMIAGALLDPAYASVLDTTRAGFTREQHRIHQAANTVWPRRLGTTPGGMAAAISEHSAALGVRYGWRFFKGRRDNLADVIAAVDSGWPVALLIGRMVPRHWVLITEHPGMAVFRVYDPASGGISGVTLDGIRRHDVQLCLPRAFALVLPKKRAAGPGRGSSSPGADQPCHHPRWRPGHSPLSCG
jgi:hypothetical protein